MIFFFILPLELENGELLMGTIKNGDIGWIEDGGLVIKVENV